MKVFPSSTQLFWAALALGAIACGKEPAAKKDEAKKGPPAVVATNPKAGDTEVDPALAEISVTFDQDMGTGVSFSGSEGLGQLPEGKQPRWEGKRTCFIPVKLEAGKFYRAAFNPGEHTSFRSVGDIAARQSDLLFCTKGAADEVKSRVVAPKAVKMTPANGAVDVDPATAELRIEFDKPMGKGTSLSGAGANYPESPAGQGPKWSEDRKTCIVPVALLPGAEYKLGINTPPYSSFRSEWGVAAEPAVYAFRTK